MRNKNISLVVGVFLPLLLSGCQSMMETMTAHYRMDNKLVALIARGNASVNHCLAHNAIEKDIAFAFNSVSAQLLDISVIDREVFQEAYKDQRFSSMNDPASVALACADATAKLPDITQRFANMYADISRDLSISRSQERRDMAAMLSNIGSNRVTSGAPVTPVTYGFPQVTYARTQPVQTNYLVNSNKGLVNCRVTEKGYVFCF